MKIIALIGLKYDYNQGDPLLFDCTEFLCRIVSKQQVRYVHLDFLARKQTPLKDKKIRSSTKLNLRNLIKRLLRVSGLKRIKIFMYYSAKRQKMTAGDSMESISEYLRKNLSGVDAIIIMGAGTIKYDVRLNFAPYYKLIVDFAAQYGIPCFINSAGIESKYDENDSRCRMFSEALSNSALKIITTRDDIEELLKYVKNLDTEIAKTADIAVWSADVYQCSKDPNSQLFGLGVITPERFREFKRDITPEQYERTIVSIIEELRYRRIPWTIFNNGDHSDAAFARKICGIIGENPDFSVLTPSSPKELVENISKFKGIIASRLHACIVAYSLDIPFVAIAWNNKLRYFAENINVEDRIIYADRLESKVILQELDRAVLNGYDNEFKQRYKQSNLEYISKYLHYIGA